MLAENTNPLPGIEERYETAGVGHQSIVGAAGMAQVSTAEGYQRIRLGCALIRLHGEWTSAPKPGEVHIPPLAALIGRFRGDPKAREKAVELRHSMVASGHRQWASERLMLIASLPSREAVWRDLGPWIASKGLDEDEAGRAILAWLEPACRYCDGLGYMKAKDSANLTKYQCTRCKGSGQVRTGQGADSILGYIRGCVSDGRQSIKKRLRGT